MKKNPFANIIQGAATPRAGEGISAPERADMVDIPPMPRGRGRPKKVQEITQSSTIFRLDEDTHYKLKKLALHDGITLNQLILKCVREHCETRGVEIY